ncbi:receptor-like protein kinase [Zingiber officinale]|uniref:receptor-like protein kinase n=1 Tax=Zingiber officinale TaxID=94328 RepID=UPI001C4C0820|nr:receptor-like protein kinase [Zingiber officinale]
MVLPKPYPVVCLVLAVSLQVVSTVAKCNLVRITSPFVVCPNRIREDGSKKFGHGEEEFKLMALSSNLILPQSVNSTRNSSDPSPCRWAGISYNRSGYVTSIELPVLRISDSLGKEIGLNRRLKKLNLVANDLSRFIPSELGNCTLLEHLKLSNNFLSGEIPVTLQNLEKLSNLALYENSLSGNIPSLLFQRPSLEIIYLNDNNLNGSIPSFNANACNVKLLQLGQNNLSGTLPYSIGNCSELQ